MFTILFFLCNLGVGPITCGLYYKQVTIKIYDCNDSGQYYKTSITIVSDAPNCGATYDYHLRS